MISNPLFYHTDCRHFRGDIPCKPHKLAGYHCSECPEYDKVTGRILIIKLGAIGDVIRTTPLVHRINQEYPSYEIWWLTYSPEVLPGSIGKILKFNLENILTLQSTDFNILINLDKDLQACSLANQIKAGSKLGFILKDGKPAPVNKDSEHKFLTGLYDDVNQANTRSYLQEIFEICGWDFCGEEYLINYDNSYRWDIPSQDKKVIGLNTGCGARWVSRLWADRNWISLINKLNDNGYFPMLLGGEQEHTKNSYFNQTTGAFYPGYFSLSKFISLVDKCDLVVSAVTMGFHIAVALRKPLVLMNNIFNPNEFELYGRGSIVQPQKPCNCFFSPTCRNDDYFCMDHLLPDDIYDAISELLKVK